MTRIIIEGLLNRASLISAIGTVLHTMNREDAFDRDEQVFVPDNDDDDDADAPPILSPHWDLNAAALRPPLPCLPCPNRGKHETLTECWMCWSDAMRGAALEPEVLAERVWRGQ